MRRPMFDRVFLRGDAVVALPRLGTEKIDKRATEHTFIHTRYGVGYKLEAEPK